MTASSFHRRQAAQPWRARTRQVGHALGLAALGLTSAYAGQADAQNCQDEDLPGLSDALDKAPRIWGRGGSAPNALLQTLAVELQESDEPLVVLYKDDGACFAMTALYDNEPLAGPVKYWYRDEATKKITAGSCTVNAAEEIPEVTWGSMAQLADSCGVDPLPDNIYDGVGPISGFALLVPNESQQQVISAEAVYYIYGLGLDDPKYHVSPWTVPAAIGSRTTTSAAGLLLAKAVGIPLDHFLYGSKLPDGGQGPNDVKTNQGMVDLAVASVTAGNGEASVGFASTETVDANRATVRALAFQAAGQKQGYWPDSTATTFDKINLREGRYFLWNPHHFYARLNGEKQIPDANVRRWIEYLTKDKPLPAGARDFIDVQIEAGNVPLCAMKVKRDGDVGPLASFQPDISCGCYYDTNVRGGSGEAPDHCQACVNQAGGESVDEAKDATCPSEAPYCRYGFCEVK